MGESFMRRMAFGVLAVVAALCTCLLTASVAGAQAPAATISVTGGETTWSPNAVTVTTGETVRWSFTGATLPHNVRSTSPNWSLNSPVDTGQAPVDHTFTAPGVYTFVCDVHPSTMSGTVTVEDPAADPLENVLVFSKTAGFRHDSIPTGIAAIQQLGAQNDFAVTATEDGAAFTDANLAQYDAVVWLSTTGDVLTDTQQDAFERYIQAGGGYVGIHAAADTEYTWGWYGQMLGGYFKNHPPGTPNAFVDIADPDEPSTETVPARWNRTDEWYNYQSPDNPSVGGGGADYSPRNSDVHVLATVDETTYDEQDDSAGADDHPIAWCSDFDGGQMWYTGMGHTQASFTEADFVEHILGGLQTVTGAEPSDCGAPREAAPEAEDFEKVTLDDDTQNPFELDIAPDGRVFYIERDGRVMIINPETGSTVQALSIPVDQSQENGMIGFQLAPDFATSNWAYVAYSEPSNATRQNTNVVARYKVVGNTLDPASRQEVFTWTHQRAECCHTSGSLYFGPDGTLYISTGDNTNPFASDGFTPIDERPGREAWDAQRTSANTNDLNGKILRIRPNPDTAGYTIPAGNLFTVGQAQTRPEIFAMGFRNPFRITVDSETGWVLMGDYGPDAGATVPGKGPQGSVEFNTVTTPGNYGWPYCIRDNTAYNDADFSNYPTITYGGLFNCASPTNNSPNNTGLTNLPPAIGADAWMGYTEQDPRHVPDLGGGGAPTGGPRYHYDPAGPPTKFPQFYDDLWFNGEWNNGWIKTFELNDSGAVTDVEPFALGTGYKRPMDLDFGPDGSLYVIEWGSGFGGNNADSGIYRIDYIAEGRRPIAHATATPDNGPTPLAVQFSSAGSVDPDGTALTYAWDFDGNGTTDSTDANPTHTYNAAGAYNATLRVTDQSGQSGVDQVRVVAGNTAPTVTIEIPEEGQFAAFGETVPYRIVVTDPEDGTINCANVTLNISLGHDQHAHELSEKPGCEGTFQTATDSGHGADANTFPVIEAVYTDGGATGAPPLTGRDIHVLQPKRKQAEFYSTTGRAPGVTGGGDPGVQTEATGDSAGGGQNIGFIENGDYVSYTPMNLKGILGLRFRVASAGAGGTIQVRLDAADGPLVAETPMITPTGGWQSYKNVDLALPNPPEGTHQLFFVFRHPTDQGGLMNVNWIDFRGKGAAVTAAPEVTATADPTTGAAPLEVSFDSDAVDPDAEPGDTLTYAWNFGVPGTDTDTSDQADPTYTYERAGTYSATLTVTDPDGGKASTSLQIRVTAGGECPQNNLRSDEFDGSALDTNRWTVIRPDATRPPTVEGGFLRFPIDNGSIYGAGTSARNIIVQPLPDGDVAVTAKISTEPLTENYQQAGLRVYQNDDNWASVHMISAGGSRDFEFIYENAGNPRNEGADKLGGIPADSPHEYWVRLISDGSQLRAEYSFNGVNFSPVGRPGDISGWANPQIGPVALSDQAPSYPVASFDWIRFDPDQPIGGGGGGGGTGFVDNFDGSALGAGWNVVRQDQNLTVGGGTLNIPAQPGDLYGGRNDAKNLVLRDAPDGEWVATAKLNFEGTAQYHQAGIIAYGDDGNFTKFGRIAHTAAGDEKFEFIYENAGTPRNEAADSTANIPADFPDDFWVRMTSDGTNVTGEYSTNGTSWTPVGRPAPLPANAQIGMFAFSNDATGNPVAAFDSFTLSGGPAGPSRDDEFDGSSLDKTRWNAIVRDTPAEYTVSGSNLTITTGPGDIYSGDTNPPPNNFILQSADHAGEDWVIETKIDSKVNGGYGQGGLLAYADGDNYVKLDPIADAGQTRINRIELRTEVSGTPTGPASDPQIAEGTGTVFWLRLTKSGTSYTGEFSRDGTTWLPAGTVTNPMADPSFGVFAFGPQAAGQGDTVAFDYFLLDGRDAGEPCDCVAGAGDEFDGSALDKAKWNAIVREQESLYSLDNGQLRVQTVAGDIYTNGDPAPTRNFFLQSADHAGADWVIETRLDITQLSDGYEQGGLLAYKDDDNYVKFDPLSDDGQTTVNRIELRSEVNGVIQSNPADPQVPAGTTHVSLRLTKTGNSYAGEYSYDGTNWTPLASPVTNPMVDPSFGIYTLGVQSSGHTVTFDYFSVDGNRGECEAPEPQNRAPVIDAAAATPTTGFAPLEVQFTSEATDPDAGDELTYSWDFDNDGTADATTADATHTYTTPGEKQAKLTVSDGEATASRTIDINVLEPDDPDARFRTLVFSKTTGFRHSSIDEGHTALELMGDQENFQVDHTEDATAFRADILEHYDTVVFLSTTGDVLNATQQAAFEAYIRAGGGYTGIHSASDTEYQWKWYGKLVGAYFLSHPANQTATVRVEDDAHPSTAALPRSYERFDEWYNFKSPDFATVGEADYSPRGSGNIQILANVDESTYNEQDGNTTDDDHPLTWCQRYDGGRSWYTAMGHTEESFTEARFLEQVLGGLETTAGVTVSAACGVLRDSPGAPVVTMTANPTSGRAPLSVKFNVEAIDPNGGPRTYDWRFGDGTRSTKPNPTHVYSQPGTYTATVIATDDEGEHGTAAVKINVTAPPGPMPPTVTATADPTAGKAPLAVAFSATGQDPDGKAEDLKYVWEFGDGNRATSRQATHTYRFPGVYTARVTVTDKQGLTDSEEIRITVTG